MLLTPSVFRAALSAALDRAATGRLVRLDAGDGKTPPTEFLIWAFGEIETSKGTFLFDKEAGDLVMAAYEDQGVELTFDYEHGQAVGAPGEPNPACGWFKPELRKDGLWATDCRWGKQAATFLAEGAYRYFSPLFEYEIASGRIVRLINCALTNTPATKNLQPLVAASEKSQVARDLRSAARIAASMSFDEVRAGLERALAQTYPDGYPWVCDVYDDVVVFGLRGRLYQVPYTVDGDTVALGGAPVEVHRTYTPIETPSQEPPMKMLLSALVASASLNLKPESTEAEAVVAVSELKPRLERGAAAEATERELLSAIGAKTPAEAKGILAAWQQAHGQLPELTAKLKEATDKLAGVELAARVREVEGLVEQGVREGKIPPASKEFWLGQGKTNPETLKAFLSTAPALVPLASDTPKKPSEKEGQPIALSDDEKAMAKRMGLSEESLLETKKAKAGAK